MLEMFASHFSRDKEYPSLLITSSEVEPTWVPTREVSKLAVGRSSFTCCERNLVFDGRIVKCDRTITRSIMDTLVTKKIDFMFSVSDFYLARLYIAMKSWWLRDERHNYKSCGEEMLSLESFKLCIHWDDEKDGTGWRYRDNISILVLAVLKNELSVVNDILEQFKDDDDLLSHRLLKKIYPRSDFPVESTAFGCNVPVPRHCDPTFRCRL